MHLSGRDIQEEVHTTKLPARTQKVDSRRYPGREPGTEYAPFRLQKMKN